METTDALDEDTMLRLGYVPIIISRLVWDYADTVADVAAQMRVQSLKGPSRQIRQLHGDYNIKISKYVDAEHCQDEIDNMMVFEDGVKDLTRTLLINIKSDIANEYPDISDESKMLAIASYQCMVLLYAVYRYVANQTLKLARKLGRPVGDILPVPMRRLNATIKCFTDRYPVSDKCFESLNTYITAISNRMALIQFTSEQ